MKKSVLLLSAALGLVSVDSTAAEDNVHFSGALVTEPCVLPDADKDIHLDFGTVIEKSLYQYQRTKSQPFNIHLTECDPSVLSTVSVTFQGTADTELTNMLALDVSSTAKGVAVGLELADGSPLNINKASPYRQLTSGTNTLTFNAFVQAQPSVISGKTLVAGDFTAISTFVLAYQ
ncbi:fimbrial protein [Atlantibacter sp.]|uniref:fimbrial protein n=1 Tax=Atlantibacter sp. TaxID=1903473 RepID=UPI0028B0C561|nr:fimbrial protein [Atlantibacter sp.]